MLPPPCIAPTIAHDPTPTTTLITSTIAAMLIMSMSSSGQLNVKINPSYIEARAAIEVVGRIVDSKGKYQPNPCSFYLLNLAIDVSTATTTNIFVDEVSANNFRIDNNR